jgi:hypothetical protein
MAALVLPSKRLAKIKVRGEKFLFFSENESGEVLVSRIAVLKGLGAKLGRRKDETALAHVHYRGLVQPPWGADHSNGKAFAHSSFVIGSTGEDVWEVGRHSGRYNYRQVKRELGPWEEFEDAE